MISKQKKLVYGSVLALTSALFAHEVVQATSAEVGPVPLELPAEVSFDAVAATSGSANAESAFTTSAGSADVSASGAANEPLGAALESLEATLARLEGPLDADRRLALSERTRRRQRSVEEVEPTHEASNAESGVDSISLERSEVARPRRDEQEQQSERMERLESLLAEQPLIGVVRGASGGAAMFGGRVVKLGDTLLANEARVTSIDERGVGLELGGQSIRIALPPLRTRPRATVDVGGAAEPSAPPVASPPAPAPAANTRGGL